jgi:hypothetical protein
MMIGREDKKRLRDRKHRTRKIWGAKRREIEGLFAVGFSQCDWKFTAKYVSEIKEKNSAHLISINWLPFGGLPSIRPTFPLLPKGQPVLISYFHLFHTLGHLFIILAPAKYIEEPKYAPTLTCSGACVSSITKGTSDSTIGSDESAMVMFGVWSVSMEQSGDFWGTSTTATKSQRSDWADITRRTIKCLRRKWSFGAFELTREKTPEGFRGFRQKGEDFAIGSRSKYVMQDLKMNFEIYTA